MWLEVTTLRCSNDVHAVTPHFWPESGTIHTMIVASFDHRARCVARCVGRCDGGMVHHHGPVSRS